VQSKDFGGVVGASRSGFQGARDLAVQFGAPALEQRVVGRLLYERMLEDIHPVLGGTADKYQLRRNQLCERAVKLVNGERGYECQQAAAELPSYARADLRHLLHALQPIQPCHKGVPEAVRDRQRGQWSVEDIAAALHRKQARLQDGFGELLHEERHPVGLGDDLRDDLPWQLLSARHAHSHRLRLRGIQSRQREARHHRLGYPAWFELGSMRHDQKRSKRRALEQMIDRLECGGIGPVQILEQHQQGVVPAASLQQIGQCPQRVVLLPLRACDRAAATFRNR
jgi:hypothetical protein